MSDEHGPHCDGCRQLAMLHENARLKRLAALMPCASCGSADHSGVMCPFEQADIDAERG